MPKPTKIQAPPDRFTTLAKKPGKLTAVEQEELLKLVAQKVLKNEQRT